MLVDHMLCTIDGARTIELAQLGSYISRAYANGVLSEDDHQRLWEAIQERRTETRPIPRAVPSSAPGASARRPQRSPDRQASIERRRRLVASGPLPPPLAARFTWGEQAVMRIVGDECTGAASFTSTRSRPGRACTGPRCRTRCGRHRAGARCPAARSSRCRNVAVRASGASLISSASWLASGRIGSARVRADLPWGWVQIARQTKNRAPRIPVKKKGIRTRLVGAKVSR